MVNYYYEWALPAPPGHECPGYAGNEKPAEAGSEVRAAHPGAGFTRLFGRSVARAFMPGRGRAGQSDKAELGVSGQLPAETGELLFQGGGPLLSGLASRLFTVDLLVELIVPEQALARDGVHQAEPGYPHPQDQPRREAAERAVRLGIDRPIPPVHQPEPL